MDLWAVVLKETGRFIGQCGLTWQDFDDGRVMEVGYLFERAFWHCEYAIEAACACRDRAFNVLVSTRCSPSSAKRTKVPIAVARRNGMVPHGALVKVYRGVRMLHTAFPVMRAERDGGCAR